MKFANRVKVASSGTSAASLTLGAAVAKARTLAQAISAGKLGVGDANVPFFVEDASGNWESGLYTIASSTQINQTRRLDSSNSGNAVTFDGGALTVFIDVPASQLSERIVYTSATCASDSSLGMTPTTGADQTAKLQALLDLAAAGPLHIIWDGAYTVAQPSGGASCLRIRGNTRITALPGCGAVMAASTGVPMWMNYNPTKTPGSVVDSNIEFIGGIWHGNRDNQTVKSTMFDFYGVTNYRFSGGIEIRKSKGFAWRATNAVRVTINDATIDFGSGLGDSDINSDGFHFNGPASHIKISQVRLYGGYDDAIALNADDGWNAITPGPLDGSYGDITDVDISDVELQWAEYGIRLLSGGSRIDNVSIRNVHGKTGSYWLVVDNFDPSLTVQTGPGNIGAVSIDGVRMENVALANSSTTAAAVFNCVIEQLSIANIHKGKFLNTQFPALIFGAKANIGQLTINGFRSYPFNAGTYLKEQVVFLAGAQVSSARLTGCQFDAPSAVDGYPIIVQSGVTIGQLAMYGNAGKNFTDFVSNSGTITYSHIPTTLNWMDAAGSSGGGTGGTVTSGWASVASGYTSVTDTGLTYSGSIAAVNTAVKMANDPYGANIQVSVDVTFTGTANDALNAAVIARGISINTWGSSAYGYYLDACAKGTTTGFTLSMKNGSGSDIVLVATKGTIAIGPTYHITLTCKATTISASVQRLSDSQWLQTDGSWGASAAVSHSAVHSGLGSSSGGLAFGLYTYAYNANAAVSGVTYANFSAIAAP